MIIAIRFLSVLALTIIPSTPTFSGILKLLTAGVHLDNVSIAFPELHDAYRSGSGIHRWKSGTLGLTAAFAAVMLSANCVMPIAAF